MPRLLLINGLPGSGKSTLAARYVADRPLALCLDVDVVRGLLGAWSDRPHEAGLLARRLALAMARLALGEGRDVVVPQFLARPAFIGELEALAGELGAEFVEVVLVEAPDVAAARLAQRAAGPLTGGPARRPPAAGPGGRAGRRAASCTAGCRTCSPAAPTRGGSSRCPATCERTYRGPARLLVSGG